MKTKYQDIPKESQMSDIERMEKTEDALRDAHQHTIHNREEVEKSSTCHCIACQTSFKPSDIDDYADAGDTALCPNCDCDAVIGDACGIELCDELLQQLHDKYFNYDDIEESDMEDLKDMETNPSIEVTFEEITGTHPTPCEPYMWVATHADRPGCALDFDYYSHEEAPARFQEFLDDVGFSLTRTVYEAVDHKFCDIDGQDALDALMMGILRYFENDGFSVLNTFYDDAPWDVDITIKLVGNPDPIRFTLHPDSSISFPDDEE